MCGRSGGSYPCSFSFLKSNMSTNYPSRSEIEALMKPILADLNRQRLIVEYEDPATPPIHYRDVVREKRQPGSVAFSPGLIPSLSICPAGNTGDSGDTREPLGGPGNVAATATHHMLGEFQRFLVQVDAHPEYNMRQHTELFGSSESFYRLKDFAERSGWITEQKSQSAKTGRYAKLIQLTPAGESMRQALCISLTPTKPPNTEP